MIHGTVVNGIEVTLRLRIFGPSGQESDIDAVIDTGFTGELTLQRQLVESLGLCDLGFRTAILANGQLAVRSALCDVVRNGSIGPARRSARRRPRVGQRSVQFVSADPPA